MRLSPRLYAAATACASASDVSLGTFVRLLLEDALASSPSNLSQALRGRIQLSDQLPALAALVAAEHSRRLLRAIVPGGEERDHQARADAIADAEVRLADVRRHLEEAG